MTKHFCDICKSEVKLTELIVVSLDVSMPSGIEKELYSILDGGSTYDLCLNCMIELSKFLKR